MVGLGRNQVQWQHFPDFWLFPHLLLPFSLLRDLQSSIICYGQDHKTIFVETLPNSRRPITSGSSKHPCWKRNGQWTVFILGENSKVKWSNSPNDSNTQDQRQKDSQKKDFLVFPDFCLVDAQSDHVQCCWCYLWSITTWYHILLSYVQLCDTNLHRKIDLKR